MQQEVMVYGIGASPGIVMGRVRIIEEQMLVVSKRRIPPRRIASEIKRFRKAIEATHKDLNQVEAAVLKTLGKQHARLIEAHRTILEDPILTKDVTHFVRDSGVNAEYALSEILNRANVAFEAIQDEFFRERRHDLFDVGRRILRHLMKGSLGTVGKPFRSPEPSIVVAKNLLPTDTIHLREQRVLAFVTEEGGKTSHVAILAQSMEIPAVVAATDALKHVAPGDEVIVDGNDGTVIVRPTVAQLKTYKERAVAWRKEQEMLLSVTQGPATTADGVMVTVSANLETFEELTLVKKFGAQGIGLFRTELAIFDKETSGLMDRQGQTEIYTRVLKEVAPNPVVIRLLDIGADKLRSIHLGGAEEEDSRLADGDSKRNVPAPAPPSLPMDLRGIRLTLRYPGVLKDQLRAILTASPAGFPKILVPMVSALEEIREVKWLLKEVQEELNKEGIPYRPDIEIGAMVEVPSMAVLAEALMAEVDFVSVGTNDLVQYTLACDRMSAELAYLYQEFHPAILHLLANVTRAAHQSNRWVGICGELAGNTLALPLLVGMGFDGISVNSHLIPRVKKNLSNLTVSRTKALVEESLKFSTHEDVVEFLKREFHGGAS